MDVQSTVKEAAVFAGASLFLSLSLTLSSSLSLSAKAAARCSKDCERGRCVCRSTQREVEKVHNTGHSSRST